MIIASFYKGDNVIVKSSAQRILDRKQYRMITCEQGKERKRRTGQLRIENYRAVVSKFIKNDGELYGLAGQLKELNATNITST